MSLPLRDESQFLYVNGGQIATINLSMVWNRHALFASIAFKSAKLDGTSLLRMHLKTKKGSNDDAFLTRRNTKHRH